MTSGPNQLLFDGFPSLAEQGKTNVKVFTAYVVERKIETTKQVIVSRPVYRFIFQAFFKQTQENRRKLRRYLAD